MPRHRDSTTGRYVGIPAFLRDVLSARIEGRRPDDLVFPAPGGGHLRNGNWRSRSGWDAATDSLGLAGVTPHDLRRTFGSLARLAGADLRWIQKAMGQSLDHHDGADLRAPL